MEKVGKDGVITVSVSFVVISFYQSFLWNHFELHTDWAPFIMSISSISLLQFFQTNTCDKYALTCMGACIRMGRLCIMNLRWWKAWSLTEVTSPHTLSRMPRHKKWWVWWGHWCLWKQFLNIASWFDDQEIWCEAGSNSF
jgi:hypothetical protein